MAITYDPRGKTLNTIPPEHTDSYDLNGKTPAETAETYGLNGKAGTYNEARLTVAINGTNLATTYGMHLIDYKISAPVPDIRLIDVPGRPGKLDASLALTGKLGYKTRKISMTFHVRRTHAEFYTLLSTLIPLFDGTESRVVFSHDLQWYYRGRFLIDFDKSNPVSGDITISCDTVFPYRLQDQEKRSRISAGASTNVYFGGKTYNGLVVITNPGTAGQITATWDGTSYILGTGNNAMRLIHLAPGPNYIQFSNSGSAAVDLTTRWAGGEL